MKATVADGATSRLAELTARATPSVDVRRRAIAPVIDSVGVMLAGAYADAGRAVLRYARAAVLSAGRGGPCWTVGVASGAPPETAALLNATAGHALDFDDSLPGSGHLSVPLLASIVATAQAANVALNGELLVDAYVIGFEVAATVGRAYGVEHYRRGWHPTYTGGTFGATAAAARILQFGEAEAANAFGIAGSLVGGLVRNFGTMTKPLHSGLAARNGVQAALLTRAGVTADHHVLDGAKGVLDLYGYGGARPEALDRLASPWSLVEPGTGLKRYPCCYAAARPLDAILQLREEHHIAAEEVEEIHCAVPLTGLHAMIHPDPSTGLNAKFSMPYVLAAAVVDGHVGLDSFTDNAIHRPSVRALMSRVSTVEESRLRPEDPQAIRSSPATGGWVELTVRLRSGKQLMAEVAAPLGSPSRPLPAAELKRKFVDCARAGHVDESVARAVYAQLDDLARVADVPALLGRLLPAGAGT